MTKLNPINTGNFSGEQVLLAACFAAFNKKGKKQMEDDKLKISPRTKNKMEITFQAFEKQFHVTFFSAKTMFSRTWDSYGTEFNFEFMPNDELYIYGNYDSMYVKGNDIYLRAYNKTFLLKNCFQYANFRCEFTGSITYSKVNDTWHINKKENDEFNQKFEDWLHDDLTDISPAERNEQIEF